MSVCPFCHLESRVIRQNQLANLFLSNPRKVPGHILVTPKRHVEKSWKLTADEIIAVFDLIHFAARRVTHKLSKGCDVMQCFRPYMKPDGVKVDHVHYHVLPRDLNDPIWRFESGERQLFEPLTPKEAAEMTQLLF